MMITHLPEAHQTRSVLRVAQHGVALARTDTLATEIPLALEYNGISHATLLVSPSHLEDLVVGFSCTEGILDSAGDLFDLEIENTEQGLIAHAHIAAECLHRLKQRRRQLAGRTGCGLCGIENLDDVRRQLAAVHAPSEHYRVEAIRRAFSQMAFQQPLRSLTGCTHAAAWADMSGTIVAVREDIGRHNALDKLLGYRLQNRNALPAGFCVVSSRASFEMVQKAASAGLNTLAAMSAATGLAADIADELGLMLLGFAREDQFTVYSHPEYLELHGEPA
jgi:FdhD protein